MQAALVAAKRGHRVTVLEKSDRIGGHVTLQAMLPGLEDRADLIRWLKPQLDKAGGEMQIGSEATPESIKEIPPDAVIIATGARYYKSGVSRRKLTGVTGENMPHEIVPDERSLEKAWYGQRTVCYDNT